MMNTIFRSLKDMTTLVVLGMPTLTGCASDIPAFGIHSHLR